ncbi:GGDEF domain-containing protein [Marinimicrobium sp. C6131]|uniref:GGDEF domain-containing protein n=1 Tax=Marinimicrobium sp. C6131 TaxID=3022676 RepID=UPI00223CEDEE|nr:GGDEF domain-containing protein [Marinimicrobium sp. C6131]UZJ43881.1 GGDEF domain-containing protein [Marinimicrobium sp. C6131]
MTLRATDDDTWREKYLDALDAHDALERQADEQYQRLRRALVQLSIVADGQDRQLDELLDELRKTLRGDQALERLPALTDQLDESVRSFEHRRESADTEVLEALTALVKQLQSLGPPRELKRELNHYLNRLPMRSQKFSLFPALLQQLAQLQQQALTLTREARPGLLGRLRGERAVEPGSAESLGDEINQVLESLMNAVNTEYMGSETLEGMMVRLKQGIPLNQLPGFLEEVRDLIMHSWLAANRVFAGYLNSVNRELAEIASLINGAADHQACQREAGRSLSEQVAERCESLAGSVESARDLSELKNQVASQLGQIRESLSQYQRAEAASEPLTDQLAQLASRVKQMEDEAEENRESLRRHQHKALHDPLTQLPNREAYDERLAHEVKRWERYGHPLTLAVCDVDHFKRINDQFGHQAGDRVLKVISKAIRRRLREVDFFGRYGGEEFVILMPETRAQDALQVLDDVRAALADTAFNYRKEPLQITISLGISEFREGDTADRVFGRADQALYAAKAAGRNQCQIG